MLTHNSVKVWLSGATKKPIQRMVKKSKIGQILFLFLFKIIYIIYIIYLFIFTHCMPDYIAQCFHSNKKIEIC
jgi:hypothetical protein